MSYHYHVLKYFATIVLLVLSLTASHAQSISRIGNSPYPATATPDTLYMVHLDGMSSTQQLAVVTLQGLLARVKPQIMVSRSSNTFINDLVRYGVTYDSTYFNNFRGLFTHFRSRIGGYILCNPDDSTTDPAISACAMMNAIAVNPPDTATMDSLGIPQLFSTINRGEVWSFDSFESRYNKKIISIQDPAKSSYLSDYSVYANAFDFFDWPTSDEASRIFSSMDINGAVFGWIAENFLVTATSARSLHVHASDFSANLSAYSNFDIPAQHQINHTDDTILKPGVHTVCFVMTDGDNIQWISGAGAFYDNNIWYANQHRGEYNLGWTISPALAELAPTMLKQIYDTAATTPAGRDGFIAAPSGLGYSYPDGFGVPDSGAAITSRMMQKADLSILNVIGNNYSAASLAPYLHEPNIDAIFYYSYQNNYYGMNGFVDCINEKPVISARFNLVQPDFSSASLAQAINAMPKTPDSSAGYSLVAVNVWSSSVDSVIRCIQLLDSNVRVVTPESFVKLYKAGNNCIPQEVNGIQSVTGSGFALYNEPNPCVDQTDIVYTLPKDSKIDIKLYDEYGKEIRTILSEYATEGTHHVTADVRSLSAGLYYYTLKGDGFSISRRCLIVK